MVWLYLLLLKLFVIRVWMMLFICLVVFLILLICLDVFNICLKLGMGLFLEIFVFCGLLLSRVFMLRLEIGLIVFFLYLFFVFGGIKKC